nr:testis-specific gene A8 protein-like [Setaria viridis]
MAFNRISAYLLRGAASLPPRLSTASLALEAVSFPEVDVPMGALGMEPGSDGEAATPTAATPAPGPAVDRSSTWFSPGAAPATSAPAAVPASPLPVACPPAVEEVDTVYGTTTRGSSTEGLEELAVAFCSAMQKEP